jgi:hypothetical protein
MDLAQQEPERLLVEQLGLGEEPHPPMAAVGEVGEDEWIEVRGVIAGEDHGPARWNEVRALDRPIHPVVQRWQQRGSGHGVHRFQSSPLSPSQAPALRRRSAKPPSPPGSIRIHMRFDLRHALRSLE